jgi:hypothetical protein
MAHSHPSTIKLTDQYNKIIRIGKSRVPYADELASRDRSTYTNIDGKTLDKPIQVYRMWYRFLQLGLELEDKNVKIVVRMQSVKLKKPKKDAWGKLRHSEMRPVMAKVKVNRKKYDGWDLDFVRKVSFDDWWKGNKKKEVSAHKQLFYPDASVSMMKNKSEWKTNPYYSHFQIDNRRRVNDIVADFRRELMEQPRNISSTLDFQITGNPNINTLINRFNALILQLTTTLRDKEMLASKYFRPTQTGMGEVDRAGEGAYTYSGSEGRAMRDLMLPAKKTLLSVCDGYFVSNANKDYLSSK